ncbi:UNVERIFIED_CONTAM: hypothetical protein K2H54_068609 [Gekko kuhli]
MWGPESPRADAPSSPCPSQPSPSDPLLADSLQRDSVLQPPSSSVSRDSLESPPGSLPGSPRAPPSLLDPSSLQSDSLERPESLVSFSFNPGDSLDPAAPPCRSALLPLFSLNDTLETSSIQRDSLQSASSTQASSLPSDSLESPCSLFDSLETSLAQCHSSGSHSAAMSRQKVSLGTAMTAQAASPQEPMVLRPPRRSPSYLSDLYQHMLRDEEVRGTERRWCQPLRSSNSTGLLNASVAEVARRQHPQSNTVTSCDPHLRPIMRRRARSLPSSPERRRNTAAQCRIPGCSTRRNRVRFADALGLELAEVKVFQAGEDPSIPLHVLSRLSINSDLCCSRRELEFTMQCLVPDFQQPADLEDFPSRLRQQRVCLERVSSSDLGLNGTVRVVNVAFEKQVAVRYTFNHWRGQHEVSSVVEFAVRYRVDEQEYWDNNQGENYSLTCRSHPLKMPRECEESWIHFI